MHMLKLSNLIFCKITKKKGVFSEIEQLFAIFVRN